MKWYWWVLIIGVGITLLWFLVDSMQQPPPQSQFQTITNTNPLGGKTLVQIMNELSMANERNTKMGDAELTSAQSESTKSEGGGGGGSETENVPRKTRLL